MLERFVGAPNATESQVTRPIKHRNEPLAEILYDEQQGKPSVNILFVCRHNSIRSPTAEIITNSLSSGRYGHLPIRVNADSAASFAPLGGLSPEMRDSLKSLGYEPPSVHPSKYVTHELVDWADYVLCMSRWHRNKLLSEIPDARGKTHLFSSLVGRPDASFHDPMEFLSSLQYRLTLPLRFGGVLLPDEQGVFDKTAKRMERYIVRFFEMLEHEFDKRTSNKRTNVPAIEGKVHV